MDRDDHPAETRIALSIDAGSYDRVDVPVSVLVDAASARSVWVEYPDGSLERSQLVEPGLLDEVWRGSDKKELHFGVPQLTKGQTIEVVAAVSERPVEGRTYVWSGEPSASRRLSCMQCHQGTAPPTARELRDEWTTFKATGRMPPLELPRLLPTSEGHDYRWHEMLGRYESSACWQCHGRHMVEYEFGQSLEKYRPPGAASPNAGDATLPAVLRSVYYKVFRTAGDQTFSRVAPTAGAATGLPCGIHFGFQRATIGPAADGKDALSGRVSDVIQRHAAILSEEAGKYIGRQCVAIDWIGDNGKGKVIATEERQTTVKNMRGRNGTRSLWIETVSKLATAGGPVRLDGRTPGAGFTCVVPVDPGSRPEYRQSETWKAITFDYDAETYTAVCFNHAANPEPLAEEAGGARGVSDPFNEGRRQPGLVYAFSAELDEGKPLLVQYRFWVQGGRMATEDIDAMSHDFLEPIKIVVK